MNRESMDRLCIGEGIYLNFVENDRYKNNYINLYFVTPLNRRTASLNTVLARVLSRGCEKYPTQMELNRALDRAFDASLDSDTAKLGEWHTLSLSLSLLDRAFAFEGEDPVEEGGEILKEVLLRPYLPNGHFDASYVESEKKLALDDLAALVNNKARYARSRMFEKMCESEPYGTPALGDRREIRRITAASLTEYFEELKKTARIEMFFVGRFDRRKMLHLAQSLTEGWNRQEEALPRVTPPPKRKKVREITETMDVTQANLVMGFRTHCTVYDPDCAALSLYNAVLGGSLTSKLFCVLREKMSLCYSVSSIPDALKGVLLIYAGIAPKNRDVAIQEALNQMEEIKKGNVTEEELENSRRALINSLNGLEDNPAVLAEWYLPRVLTDRKQTPSSLIADLQAVTLEDVVKIAHKIQMDTIYTLTAKEVEQ